MRRVTILQVFELLNMHPRHQTGFCTDILYTIPLLYRSCHPIPPVLACAGKLRTPKYVKPKTSTRKGINKRKALGSTRTFPRVHVSCPFRAQACIDSRTLRCIV
jgi:hypothetical protein